MKLIFLLFFSCSSVSDVDLMASLIHSECSNCSETEQYLVGSVVINRVSRGEFPSSIRGVIYQRNQFHGVSGKMFYPTIETRRIAKDLLNGLYITPHIVYFCTHDSQKPMRKVLIRAKYHTFGI